MKITDALKRANSEWIDNHEIKSAIDINTGYCADYATLIAEQHGFDIEGIYGLQDIDDLNNKFGLNIDGEEFHFKGEFLLGHTFLHYDGLFFDAEAIEGVQNPIDLPIVKRVLEEKKQMEINDAPFLRM